jgi:dynein heavy chain
MRMIFEIKNLKFASPATVSRAGILYISDMTGYQWRSYVKSWIQQQTCSEEMKVELQKNFDTYVAPTLDHIKKSFKYLIPVVEISSVIALCKLLESIMAAHEIKGLAFVFVFCCVWCFGAGFDEKDGKQYRKEFSTWWKDTFKLVRFGSKGTVFDYMVDYENPNFIEWSGEST